jgi:hypothetical protein
MAEARQLGLPSDFLFSPLGRNVRLAFAGAVGAAEAGPFLGEGRRGGRGENKPERCKNAGNWHGNLGEAGCKRREE